MTNFSRYSIGLGLLAAVLFTACSTINVKAAWKNPSYLAHPQKIMVIGLSKNPALRRIFEDEFVRQIKAHGADATASYMVLPDMDKSNQTAIAEKVKERGADTVLITRLVSTKTVQVYVPGTAYVVPANYGQWSNYYNYGYQTIYTPGYMAEEEYAVIETNMYDAASDALIWSAWSEAGITGSDQSLIKAYINTMVKTMVDQNLLRK